MFNKVVLVGALTRDIELRYSQSGVGIAKTAIATNRKFTKDGEKREEVMFIDITFFGRSAEVANQFLRKGSKILVEGHIQFEQWTDQNGQKRSKHTVSVSSMQMLDSKADNQAGNAPQSAQEPRTQQQGYQSPQQQQNAYEGKGGSVSVPEIDIDEQSIPFAPIGLQYPMSLHVI